MKSETYFVHPSSYVDDGAVIGAGTKIWHFSHVMSGAQIGEECMLGQNVYVGGAVKIGRGCRVQNNVSLYDGVILEDEVFVGPSVVFTNVKRPKAGVSQHDAYLGTHVGRGATIGANATIVCGVTIGENAMIGAGSVVTHDVPAGATVAGNPANLLIC